MIITIAPLTLPPVVLTRASIQSVEPVFTRD